MNGKQRGQAVMILHGGKVVYETYPGLDPNQPRFWASASKTTVGLLVSMLEAEGVIDTSKPVTAYAKQLAGSEWDKVRVIDALNMAVGLDISEDAKATMDPMSMFQRFVAADFGVPNAKGVRENPVDVLRARPSWSEWAVTALPALMALTIRAWKIWRVTSLSLPQVGKWF